tara:strand:- start:480 stop:1010 length:531 start_codon:yes stop_codon:yes gene_type:complete
MSNLRFLNETTVGSSVSTVDVTDVFTSDFDIYKIVVPQMVTNGTASTDVAMRFINSSGSVVTSSEYDYANLGLKAYNPFAEEKGTNGSYIEKFGQADQEPEGTSIVSYVFNPFLSSSYTFVLWQDSYSFGSGKGGGKGIGVLTEISSITGFQLYAVSQTRPFDSSKIRTYGLRVDT